MWNQVMDCKLPQLIFVIFLLSIAQSTHTANNGASHVVKKVQKNFNNYASVECGAKILGANPEAKVLQIWYYIVLGNLLGDDKMIKVRIDLSICSLQSTSAILMENMDLYMLNPCSNKIWCSIHAPPAFYPPMQLKNISFYLHLKPIFEALYLVLAQVHHWALWAHPGEAVGHC